MYSIPFTLRPLGVTHGLLSKVDDISMLGKNKKEEGARERGSLFRRGAESWGKEENPLPRDTSVEGKKFHFPNLSHNQIHCIGLGCLLCTCGTTMYLVLGIPTLTCPWTLEASCFAPCSLRCCGLWLARPSLKLGSILTSLIHPLAPQGYPRAPNTRSRSIQS